MNVPLYVHMQPEKIKVPVQCHVGTEDKFVLAEVTGSRFC